MTRWGYDAFVWRTIKAKPRNHNAKYLFSCVWLHVYNNVTSHTVDWGLFWCDVVTDVVTDVTEVMTDVVTDIDCVWWCHILLHLPFTWCIMTVWHRWSMTVNSQCRFKIKQPNFKVICVCAIINSSHNKTSKCTDVKSIFCTCNLL
jgi:hypothetical protein